LTNRAEMKKVNITAYLVLSTDAHQSEYLAPEDRRRQYISGESVRHISTAFQASQSYT
jgi:hypothetical protein